MKKYLIFETEGTCKSSLRGIELAIELAELGCEVTLWLMQDAIQLLQTRDVKVLSDCLGKEKLIVYIDEFSLNQRGCPPKIAEELGINISNIDVLSQQLMEQDTKPIWH